MTTLQEIYAEWSSNPRFRKAFNEDPEAAIKEAGFEVNQDDLIKIQALIKLKNKKSKDEELDKRINK